MVDTPQLPAPVLTPTPLAKHGLLELPLFQETAKAHRRRRWPAFSVSKVDPVSPDIVPTSDGFFLGSLSDKYFCRCVKRAPSHVQNAFVRRVMWWRARKSPLRHQFIVLTVSCSSKTADNGNPPVLYDLRVERVGKGFGPQGLAEHKITSTLVQPLEHYTKTNELMFGLLAEEDASVLGAVKPGSIHTKSAFLDVLDDKWRGPPPTLWYIVRYIEYIVDLAPRYRLASTNCYYFARLLMYTVGLRHYSFPTLAAGRSADLVIRSQRHDPSGISMLFRFLHQEEKSNGVLLYATIDILLTLFLVSLAVVGSALWFWMIVTHFSTALLVVGSLACIPGSVLLARIYEDAHDRLVETSRNTLRRETETLVKKLDSDIDLTAPRGKRGDYKLPTYLISETHTVQVMVGSFPQDIKKTRMVESHEPRRPVPPWDNPEQVYHTRDDISPQTPRMPDSTE